MDRIDLLSYWIKEREAIRRKKEDPIVEPPYTEDEILQKYHFCNVNRQDDRGTKEIQSVAQRVIAVEDLPWAYTLGRMLNYAPSFKTALDIWDPTEPKRHDKPASTALWGIHPDKVFHTAYVVSTCGKKMDKVQYVLGVVRGVYEMMYTAGARDTCRGMYRSLLNVNGLGSFMAGQIVADLKNDRFMPHAEDFFSFSVMGPGSQKGLNWLYNGGTTHATYDKRVLATYQGIDDEARGLINSIQDFQNCLCEFSKYVRYKFDLPGRRRTYVSNRL